MKTPAISVIMPAYNVEDYIKEAIDSILKQTYGDFEFIIINDGSTDKTEEIIQAYNDPRIVYIKNEKRMNITDATNRGLEYARGRYIAMMDSDDISLPDRFEKQIKFMQSNPDIDVCGTYIENFGDRDDIMVYPQNHNDIAVKFLFYSSIPHSAILAKREFYEDIKYENEYNRAQDYALWVRGFRKYRYANIPEVLYLYRRYDKENKESQKAEMAIKVKELMLSYMGDIFDREDAVVLSEIADYRYIDIDRIADTYNKIITRNQKLKIFDDKLLRDELSKRLWWMLNSNTDRGVKLFMEYNKSPLSKLVKVSTVQKYKFFIKSLIGYSKR